MTSERNSFNPETRRDHEALKDTGIELRERLRQNREKTGEHSHENIDEIRNEVEALQKERLDEKHEEVERPLSPAERRNGPLRKTQEEAVFKATMKEIHGQMSAPSRAFSKFIHNKVVERVSEVTGATVARPDAILSGAVCAFVLTIGVYLVAKNLGYPLSGFETIGAFILGWALGVIFDFLKVMVTGRK